MSLTLLTERNWLSLFTCDQVSFAEFKRTFTVVSGSNRVPLKEYAAKYKVSDTTLRNLHRWIVLNMRTYLSGVYKASLRLPDDVPASIMQVTMHNSQKATSKSVVRNLFMRELWQRTRTGASMTEPFLVTLFQLCNEKAIDSKLLTPSASDLIADGKFAPVMSGFYFRASVLNPALVYTLSTKRLKGLRVFTPTLGWSSYLLGFFANKHVVEYVGTDVIPRVCRVTQKIAAKYYPDRAVTIHCTPSEDLLNDKTFMRRNKERFDVVFFSPPYYRLELYEGKNQSTRRYPEYEQWLEGYWDATMRLCAHVMTPDAKMGYIVSPYGDKKELVNDMVKISALYFRRQNTIPISNLNVNNTKHRHTGESLYLFKKKKCT
jgi:hypothetical protein